MQKRPALRLVEVRGEGVSIKGAGGDRRIQAQVRATAKRDVAAFAPAWPAHLCMPPSVLDRVKRLAQAR
jgi:hypothetical protein